MLRLPDLHMPLTLGFAQRTTDLLRLHIGSVGTPYAPSISLDTLPIAITVMVPALRLTANVRFLAYKATPRCSLCRPQPLDRSCRVFLGFRAFRRVLLEDKLNLCKFYSITMSQPTS